ncbi:MAG: prepilin-type N-terminal cleavage/methylation domain-containing protein [Verrucomicrobiota bacterium]|nr:prepilin-type N-terminal cleavage/methylation domain-containing protein [Verrucomicrobiota bacterium]
MRAGFTLTEVLFTMAIFTVVGVGVGVFTIDTGRLMFVSTAKLEMAGDMRQITMQLSDIARESNEYHVYTSYSGGVTAGSRQTEGGRGDCLVLIFQEPRNTTTGLPDFAGATYIYKLVVYFRESGTGNLGPVKTFTIEYPGTSAKLVGQAGNSVEELVNAYSGPYREIVQLAKGLANAKLFYLLNRECIMVKAEIYHGNKVKEVTNTYNFTISPRG